MFDFKNASKQDLKAEYNRIAREIGDDRFFTKKELITSLKFSWMVSRF
ncbi:MULTISPECIES: hypothetical protein [Paraburkholderia]|nr:MULTISPECIES: hypothetical protein [Paraburkholderia]MDH6148517.1 hypothetical protein [Paraburkholderia sp. WSM4179]